MTSSNLHLGAGPARPRQFLETVPNEVAFTWNYRLRIELEAADQFARLARRLAEIGADDKIVGLAQKASEDENRHGTLCRKIISASRTTVRPITPQLGVALGPASLSLRAQTLYACVAISCITETLSTALLVEMQNCAEPTLIRHTVHSILEDEIQHSRIGWAHLASEANRADTSWLADHLPGMLRDAIASDAPALPAPRSDAPDLSRYGILPREKATAIMLQTVTKVILPGLRRFRISTTKAEAFATEFSV